MSPDPPGAARAGRLPAGPRTEELQAAEADDREDYSQLAGWKVPDHSPPALLRIRIVDLHEPLIACRRASG